MFKSSDSRKTSKENAVSFYGWLYTRTLRPLKNDTTHCGLSSFSSAFPTILIIYVYIYMHIYIYTGDVIANHMQQSTRGV